MSDTAAEVTGGAGPTTSNVQRIPLRAIRPNPFHHTDPAMDMERREILRALSKSMKTNGWWPGTVVRPAPDGDGYEQAFGHLRVEAARRVLGDDGIVDFIVLDLDDEEMLRHMAAENISHDREDRFTVEAVRRYLAEHATTRAKKARKDTGPSAREISRFLGEVWTEERVQRHLRVIVPIESGAVVPEVAEVTRQLATPNALLVVRAARQAPAEEQRVMAKAIADLVEHGTALPEDLKVALRAEREAVLEEKIHEDNQKCRDHQSETDRKKRAKESAWGLRRPWEVLTSIPRGSRYESHYCNRWFRVARQICQVRDIPDDQTLYVEEVARAMISEMEKRRKKLSNEEAGAAA